jgi:small subunit ribosomal protein S8
MDTVADALIRIKNGYMAHLSEVALPYSKLIKSICEVLEKEGYVTDLKEVKTGKNEQFKGLMVSLKYDKRKPVLSQVKRISKPGLRVYKGKTALPYVLNGLGIALISTPKGIMTDKQARKEGVGGEVLAYVW